MFVNVCVYMYNMYIHAQMLCCKIVLWMYMSCYDQYRTYMYYITKKKKDECVNIYLGLLCIISVIPKSG